MNLFRIPAFLVLCLLSLAVAAGSLQPGRYVLLEGWGSLTLGPEGPQGQAFSIETTGSNLHVCNVDGAVRGSVGVPAETYDEPCRISFKAKGRDIELGSGEGEACRMYCGARAYFDGTYRLPPPACELKQQRQRKDLFLKQYRAKAYDQAQATLAALVAECGVFHNWIEKDRLRNDLAVTQYHLGRPAECLKTLEQTIGWSSPDEKTLQEDSGLPPSDFDSYIDVAKATWINRALCERRLKAKK